jgi:hypothetical protein
MKFQGKDYYERYKTIKRSFKKERRDLLNKNKMLEYETKLNIDANNRISRGDVKSELSFFKKKVGLKNDDENKDEDIAMMVDILNSQK